MSSMEQWAQYYRSQGLSVIPVSGKIPLIKWAEFQERRASEEEIKAWWEKWPEADLGCVTGAISNRLVLDVDGEEGAAFVREKGVPETYTVKTKKGTQYHFLWPLQAVGKTTLVGIAKQLDSRGEAGYCKLPPSKFSDDSGRYQSDGTADCNHLAECPQWLLDLLIEKNKPREINREAGESWLKEKLDGLREGNRNHSFTAIAGSLRSRGYTSTDIYELLSSRAEEIGFSLEELRTICESVGGYTPRVQVTEEAQSVSEFLADEETVDWIVPGLIAKNSIGFIHGQPQTAKSWMAFDLAIECARGGGEWLGKFPVNECRVLLVEAERFKGETQRRLKALIAGKGINGPLDLFVKAGSTTRLNLQQSLDAFKRTLAEQQPELVIWDSWATAHTCGEKDRMEIQKVLEIVKELRQEFGCAFFWVNHDTKQSLVSEPGTSKQPSMNDMQGNTAVAAAAELMFGVRRKDNESCMVYNTKNTLANSIEPFEVRVIDVENGIRVEGR